MNDPIFQVLPKLKFLTDDQFEAIAVRWVRELRQGMTTVEDLAENAYQYQHPLTIRHIKRLKNAI